MSSYVVGLMSGTSLDGTDAALVKISGRAQNLHVELVHYLSLPYTDVIKQKLAKLCIPEKALIKDISAMNMLLGELFAELTLQLIDEAGLLVTDVLLISSHGQTIYHQPNSVTIDGHQVISTLQIGDISVIAERVGVPVVGDFRTRDIAAGGQGAPLVPYGDYLIFKNEEFGRTLVNIGGIANITVIPRAGKETDVIAYDTGPGNMLIDNFTHRATKGVQSYDKDGALGSQGIVNETFLAQILAHEYFKLTPPKSTGREMFGVEFADKLWRDAELMRIKDVDKIATITELTAVTISKEINKYIEGFGIKEVLISGGGRFNGRIMKRLRYHLHSEVTLNGTEKYKIDSDAKEAIIFALLGYQCYHKQTNTLPSATGAKNSVVMGKMAW